MSNVDPGNWFLPPDVVPRHPSFTSGNEVIPLIDGNSYMSHLSGRIAAMKAGDYLHLTGWRVTSDQLLEPSMAGPSSFLQQILALITKKVMVRAILWYHFGSGAINWNLYARLIAGLAYKHPLENMNFVTSINNLNSIYGKAILDARLPLLKLASHHQKTIVLSAEGHDWAYVGGIDICLDRWDVNQHNGPTQRQKELMEAWHDIQVTIRGPAVAQIWENFKLRWNDTNAPHHFPFVPGGSIPPPITSPPPAEVPIGTQHVQVLRTLACGGVYSFMPLGEQTIRLAYERAIDKANHFIYIEEQYFWPCSIIENLKMAVGRGVKIILVLSHTFDLKGISQVNTHMRAQAINYIRQSNPDNVYVCHLQQAGLESDIYVHSKLMIVDDCYVALGTANINQRSHTTDTELHLGIVDENTVKEMMNGTEIDVCKFARDLRLTLWREHLGLPDNSLIDDPIKGLTQWPNKISPNRKHHAVYHPVDIKPVDKTALRRFLLQLFQAGFTLSIAFPNVPPELIPDSVLEALIPDPEGFIRDHIMNVKTVC